MNIRVVLPFFPLILCSSYVVIWSEGVVPCSEDMYYALCDDLEPEERAATQRSMGMKMEQLKAELKMLDHAHDDD